MNKKFLKRFLTAKEIENNFSKVLQLLDEGKIKKALSLYNKTFCYDPYNGDVLYGLARYYAKKNNEEQAIYYLIQACDADPAYLDKAKKDTIFSNYIDSKSFKSITDDELSRMWNVIKFQQIEPKYDHWKVILQFDKQYINEIKKIYAGFYEEIQRYFKIDDECIRLESDCDRYYVWYARLLLAIKKTSPFLKNARFTMSGESLNYIDEIVIDQGTFYVYSHETLDSYVQAKLEVMDVLARKYPDDRKLREYLSYEYANGAKIKINYGKDNKSIELSKKYLRLAFKFYPENPEAFYQQARFFNKLGKNVKAKEYYLKTIKQMPEHFDALYDLGLFEFKEERCLEAIDCFTKALAIKPLGSDIYFHRGMAYEITGDKRKAENDYEKDIEITSFYAADSLITRGHKLFDKGLSHSSLLYLKSALIKNSEYKKDINKREKNSSKTESNRSFYAARRKEIKERDADAYIGLSITEEDNNKQLEYTNKALALNPDSVAAWYNKGLFLQMLNKEDEAEICYDKALSLDPNYIKALNNKTVILANRKDYRQALKYAERILKIDDTYSDAWLSKGNVYVYLKDYEKAKAAYKKFIKYNPSSEKGYHGLGLAYSWCKEYKKAITIYNKALAINPKLYTVISDIGSNLNNLGRYAEALKWLDKAIAIKSDYYHPYYCKACIFSLTGKEEEALQMVEKTIQLDQSQKRLLKKEADLKKLWKNKRFKKLVS